MGADDGVDVVAETLTAELGVGEAAELVCSACGQRDWPAIPSPAPVCPYCGEDIGSILRWCPHCERDLLPLRRTTEMANRYFNQAVEAARAPDWGLAAENLAVTLALCPDDVDALVLLGKVRRAQGNHAGAVATWEEALRIQPGRPDIEGAIQSMTPGSSAATSRRPQANPPKGRPAKGRPRPKSQGKKGKKSRSGRR